MAGITFTINSTNAETIREDIAAYIESVAIVNETHYPKNEKIAEKCREMAKNIREAKLVPESNTL